jgi:chemotaxis signal transduction protein
MDASAVRDVARVWNVLPCSRSGSPVCGLVKVRGRAVPVYDLASLLGCRRSRLTTKSRLIVAEGEYGVLAFVVDSVTRTVRKPQPVYGKALVQMDGDSERPVDIGETLSHAQLN